MDFKYENGRIYLENDNGDVVAEIEYEEIESGVYNIYHTFVDDSLRGQGIASQLVKEAVKTIESIGGKVEATCSYAKHWLEKNNK